MLFALLTSKLIAVPVRPTMPETTALGAAMAAGAAKGVDVWTLTPDDKAQITTDNFSPVLDPKGEEKSAISVNRSDQLNV